MLVCFKKKGAGCKESSVSSLWSKLFHLLVWRNSASALVRPALSWFGSLTFIYVVLIAGWEKRCWGWGEQLLREEKTRERRKGKMRKVMHVLGLFWNCGWWVDTWWLCISGTSGARWILNSSTGSMFSFGSFFRKTNPLTSSCIVLCAGNCFPASCGKTAAGFHDTSVEDGSLASRCIFREHQLIVILIPCFILETSTRYISECALQKQMLRSSLCCP